MASNTFLTFSDVTFRYFEQSKRNILDGVSFSIEQGKTVVFLGKSGCGKSTLAAVAAGLYPENSGILSNGSVFLDGTPVQDLKPNQRARLLPLLFQNPGLQFCMDSLRDELRFCMENLCVPPSAMDDRILKLSARFCLNPLLDRKLHTLSGGEQQKAALCCLFALQPKGVFLDEPFANIDENGARELLRLLKQQREQEGLTVLAIDHRPDLWLETADEFILLGDKGRVIRRGITPANLHEHKDLFLQEGIFFPEANASLCRMSRRHEQQAQPQEAAIAVDGLTISHPREEPLLSKASAVFYRSQITAVLGPSGAGKTSLFYTLLGRRPYSGSIRLGSRELKTMKPRSLYKEMGMVFQNPERQFISQNVLEEAAQSLKLWNRPGDPKALLETVGLGSFGGYSPYMLSQGQQRRLAVLSMLAGGQRILLLDEPTYGQDESSVRALMELLVQRVTMEGLTVILITHDQRLACEYADRRYLLQDRRLTELQEGGTAHGTSEPIL